MRALPDELETSALIPVLADGWDFDVASAEYAPVGGGSYHWVVADHEERRGFVTVDDLDWKPWLGDTRDSVLEGLRRAFDTAAALRDSGLEFVVAPIPDDSGQSLRRLGPRYSIALFPLVVGRAGHFGRYEPSERAAFFTMLDALHRATPFAMSVASSIELDLPGRAELEAALRDMDEPWTGGPFSERARQAIAEHASDIVDLLALGDRLADVVAARSTKWVVTHGEPHGGNVISTGGRHVLVDWDTVALAPRERDFWMLVDDPSSADAVARDLDPVGLSFFRLRWDLADLAAFTNQLRSPHRQNEDTAKAYEALIYYVGIRDRWAALL
jgi:spectinomycin phosphotransferase